MQRPSLAITDPRPSDIAVRKWRIASESRTDRKRGPDSAWEEAPCPI
jgi:hypothetical protein